MPAMSVRLPEDLKEQMAFFSRVLGISQNAMVVMALEDFLERKQPSVTRKRREKEFEKEVSEKLADYISRNAPCPCGSGKKYKRCCAR